MKTKWKRIMGMTLSVLLVLTAVVGFGNVKASEEPITLSYVSWAAGDEQADQEAAIAAFMEENPNIIIEAEFVPYDDYHSKINTLIAAGSTPDVYYINEYLAVDWGEKGVAADLKPLFEENGIDMDATFLPNAMFKSAEGNVYGVASGVVNQMLFFNKEMFDEAGIAYPPQDPAEAWTWDEYIEVCKKLTTDASGLHPGDSGFNANSTVAYGTKNITFWLYMMPTLYSNDASFFSEDGMSTGLDTPEAKEVLQAFYDMMYVDQVAPTGATAEALPGHAQLFKNKQLATLIEGSWEYLTFANEGIDVGIAPVPGFKESKTIAFAAANQISATTEHPQEAFEFLYYFIHPETNPLQVKSNFPNVSSFYEEENMDKWTQGDVYNEDFKTVVPLTMDPEVALIPESVTIKNFGSLMDEVYSPALDKLWLDEVTVDEVVDEIIKKSEGMYEGRWDN
ncbi:MAG: ABC transporter substrate-binding protein [bacterium]